MQRIFSVNFRGSKLEFGWKNVRKKGEGNDLGEAWRGAYRNNNGMAVTMEKKVVFLVLNLCQSPKVFFF